MLTENPSVTGMIVQKWILKNQDWKVQIRFILLKAGISGAHLWT